MTIKFYNLYIRLLLIISFIPDCFWQRKNNQINKKHIALLSDSLVVGGIEKLVVTRSIYLNNQQYQVDIVLLEKIGDFLDLIPDNIRLFELSKTNKVRSLINYIKTEQPNIIIASNLQSIVLGLYVKIILRNNIILIVTVDTMHSIRFGIFKKEKNKYTVSLMRYFKFLLYLSDKVLAVSNTVAKDINKFSVFSIKNKTVVNYSPIDIELIKKLKLEHADDISLADKNCKIILSVGRLVSIKDHTTLLQSFAIVRKKYNVKLIILGDGILKYELIKLSKKLNIEEYVLFRGNVLNPYVYMHNSDVFVMSSIVEGFSVALLESIACGTPFVGTNCGSIVEVMELLDLYCEKDKYIVPVGDINSLAQAIINMLNDPISSNILIEKSINFNTDKSMMQFERILNQ